MNNIEANKRIVAGAYRKFKSYYFYNKSFLAIKSKIAEFESDPETMIATMDELANYLTHPRSNRGKEFEKTLLESIDFYVLPKITHENTNSSNKAVCITNLASTKNNKCNINFFINCDICLHIIDTVWTIYLAKIAYDNGTISYDVYGNTINNTSVFYDGIIDFDSLILFNRYYPKYCAWRNGAFQALDNNYERKQDSLLISLDIKSFYYSITFDFSKITQYFGKHEDFREIKPLTTLMKKVYGKYHLLISKYYKKLPINNHTSSILPIGLFSSMLLSNVYLADFDKLTKRIPGLLYYGRYVDDMLFVINTNMVDSTAVNNSIDEVLVKNRVLTKTHNGYSIAHRNNLIIKPAKIKLLYIDHTESRAIIDLYNEHVRRIPSQMDPAPIRIDSISDFNLNAYDIGGLDFKKINKLESINIKPLNTSRFFALLPLKNMGVTENRYKDIALLIRQIRSFYQGTNIIEYSNSWSYYFNFLINNNMTIAAKLFYKDTIGYIETLIINSRDYNNKKHLNNKLRICLTEQLDISLQLALALNIECAKNYFKEHEPYVRQYINSNIFNHNLVLYPLANYLNYSNDVSYSSMRFKDLGEQPDNIDTSHKYKWSPRFVHFEELLLTHFYKNVKDGETSSINYLKDAKRDYIEINRLSYDPIPIQTRLEKQWGYELNTVSFSTKRTKYPNKLSVAVGSINIKEPQCLDNTITSKQKNTFIEILSDTYKCFNEEEDRKNNNPRILVLPELYCSFRWINELIKFSKRSQTAIITGFKYIEGENGFVHNYLATFLPYTSNSAKKYKNLYVDIREKNDYSPKEFVGLSKNNLKCDNRTIAVYSVYDWNNIKLSSIICYELTDVVVRALLKGRCDLIALPVYNKDTSYYSNIIESTVRDLHAFIIQANTSRYGDSRVTGPYKSECKDIFKIKGGDNDHVVIGILDYGKVKEYEENYNYNLNKKISRVKGKTEEETTETTDIKPLSARFKNDYTNIFYLSAFNRDAISNNDTNDKTN